MTALLDPSAILAAADRSDMNHRAAAAWFGRIAEPLAMSAVALAEADHVLRRTLGAAASDALLESVESGAIQVVGPTPSDVARARALRRAAGDAVSLADALTAALAERLPARRVATFHRRPYSMLRPHCRVSFDLEP